MKKTFALILTMILFLSLFPTVVSAENMPTVIVSNAEAKVGDTVKITVSVQNNPGIMSMQLKIGYDSNALKFEGAEELDFKNLTYGPPTKNPFITTWIEPLITENNTTDGVFVKLEFTVLDTAPNGKSEIAVSYDADEVFDIKFDNVNFNIQNGYIDIKNVDSNQQQDSSPLPTTSSETSSGVVSVDDLSESTTNSSQSQDIVEDASENITTNNATDNVATEDDEHISDTQNDWLMWVVVAAVMLLGGAFAIVIIKSKKEK